MKLLEKIGITIAACAIAATGGTALAGSNAPRAAVSAGEPARPDAAVRTFPVRLGGTNLERAQQVGGTVLVRRARALVARFRICVAPSGAVVDLELTRRSGAPAFDRAVLDSARTWTYAAFSAPAGTRVCNPVSIIYRAS